MLSVAEIRRWVSGVGERRQRGLGGGAGGYCLLGDLSSNTSRQAASTGHGQRGRTRGLLTSYPRGGQPPALVEIKNSLYYTSHSAPFSAHPFGRFHPRSFCTASPLFAATTSSSSVVPPHASSFLLSSPSVPHSSYSAALAAPRSRGPT